MFVGCACELVGRGSSTAACSISFYQINPTSWSRNLTAYPGDCVTLGLHAEEFLLAASSVKAPWSGSGKTCSAECLVSRFCQFFDGGDPSCGPDRGSVFFSVSLTWKSCSLFQCQLSFSTFFLFCIHITCLQPGRKTTATAAWMSVPILVQML